MSSKVIHTDVIPHGPNGSVFQIDKFPFECGSAINYSSVHLDDDIIENWPMLYILASNKTAYVGQTNNVSQRMAQHSANEERRQFNTCNLIYNSEFNTSVITDYEHRLICSMQADGKYTLTNKNEGMSLLNYYSKAEYDKMFRDLWEYLREMDLAEKSLDEIEDSEVFKFSPFKSLTPDQKVALDNIRVEIENGLSKAHPIVVQGMPGTGKTVLAIYLLKALKDNPKYKDWNIKIVEPITALRKSLKNALRGVAGIKSNDIVAPSDIANFTNKKNPNAKPLDIVLVDEAHKLKQRVNLGAAFGNFDKNNARLGLAKDEGTQLDWILKQTKLPIFFYDPLQSIGPSCVTQASFYTKLRQALENPITLDSQMRVKGGKEYLEYIDALLNQKEVIKPKLDEYEYVIHKNFGTFMKSFEKAYSNHNLTRKIAGYAWEWATKNDPNAYDIEIDGHKLKWNCTNENWVGLGFNDEDIAREVGCIHSIQGYDLSYAFVIIGNDIYLDKQTGQIKADKNSYFDRNGKATATQEELDQYIKNIYYVLLTRGIFGTHVYICDDALRKYFLDKN